MGFTEILIALAKIFILLLPGFLLKKLNIVNEGQTTGVSTMLMYVTYPCLVIHAMQMPFSIKILNNCKDVVLVYVGITVLAILCAKIIEQLIKLPRRQSGLLTFMLVFGNTGFIGLPVLNGLFGTQAVFYGAICDLTSSVFMFTFGIAIVRSTSKTETAPQPDKIETLKEFFNPCVVGVIIGFVLFITNTTLPEILGGPIQLVGDATTPLAMFVVGAKLAELKLREMVRSRIVYLICLLKLILMPLAALVLAYLFISIGSLLAVIVVEAAMPVAMSSVIFSQQYRGDADFAARGVLASTLLCILTIPLAVVLLTLI